jgi:hypothetical protein
MNRRQRRRHEAQQRAHEARLRKDAEQREAKQMLLYHFTLLRYLKHEGTIITEGLKPQSGQCGLESHDVVWLTTNSETIFAIAWDRAGNLVKQKHDCRITLVIPSHDRKLVNWLVASARSKPCKNGLSISARYHRAALGRWPS